MSLPELTAILRESTVEDRGGELSGEKNPEAVTPNAATPAPDALRGVDTVPCSLRGKADRPLPKAARENVPILLAE